MKTKVVLVVFAMVVILNSFTVYGKGTPVSAQTTVQVLGTDGSPRPDWLYKAISAQDRHYETGYGKMSDKQMSINQATIEAKAKISGWLSTTVEELVCTYVNDTGSMDVKQYTIVTKSISEQPAQAILDRVVTEEMWNDTDGGVWVLCSLSLDLIEKDFKPASEAVAEAFTISESAIAANAKMQDALAALLKGSQ